MEIPLDSIRSKNARVYGCCQPKAKPQPTAGSRVMIPAMANANGVPTGEQDEAEDSGIMAYLMQYQKVEAAKLEWSQAHRQPKTVSERP
jgi:hypothetical protein